MGKTEGEHERGNNKDNMRMIKVSKILPSAAINTLWKAFIWCLSATGMVCIA